MFLFCPFYSDDAFCALLPEVKATNSLYRAAFLQTSSGFFCSVNHLSGGGVNANHNAAHSPSLALKNKIESDPKLLKNSEGNRDDEWNFC